MRSTATTAGLLITLTTGIGGSVLSTESAASVAMHLWLNADCLVV